MNNLLLYCGLVGAKIRASDKDLPVPMHVVVMYQQIKVSYVMKFIHCGFLEH